MWSELSPVWQAAVAQSWEAYCAGSLPIGAVVADGDGCILSRGRNRINELSAPAGLAFNSNLAHAEINALLALPPADMKRRGFTLYTVLEPCPMCLGAIYMSGLRSFAYACRDSHAGSANLLGKTPYLSSKLFTVTGPQNPRLEAVILAMQMESMFHYMGPDKVRLSMVYDPWKAAIPESVCLGEQLFQTGGLQQMRTDCLPASTMLDTLDSILPTFDRF